MKKSLMNQALFLSVIALALAGTGCERKGRAPKKNTSDQPGLIQPDGNKRKLPESTTVKDEKNTDEKKTEDGKTDETAVNKLDAQWTCSYSINEKAELTVEELKKDSEAMTAFRKCTMEAGVTLHLSGGKARIIDESQKIGEGADAPTVKGIREEFKKLAKAGNESDARKVLHLRLDAAKAAYTKFAAKYAKAELSLKSNDKDIAAAVMAEQMARAAEAVDAIRSFVDGKAEGSQKKDGKGLKLEFVAHDGSLLSDE